MTRAAKCEVILERIIEMVNTKRDARLIFAQDWGGNTLTVFYGGNDHGHYGSPDGSFSNLVDELYKGLHRLAEKDSANQ